MQFCNCVCLLQVEEEVAADKALTGPLKVMHFDADKAVSGDVQQGACLDRVSHMSFPYGVGHAVCLAALAIHDNTHALLLFQTHDQSCNSERFVPFACLC